jgi:hypothetical protein
LFESTHGRLGRGIEITVDVNRAGFDPIGHTHRPGDIMLISQDYQLAESRSKPYLLNSDY